MASHGHRIFVGNLPHEVTRDQLVSKFKDYGTVESVEVKTKKDATTDQVIATFSYVNLNTDKESLNQCILLLNGVKWGQRHLKVEVAKESFLQRLQRERQSAKNSSATQQASVPHQPPKKVSESPSKVSLKENKIFKKQTIRKRPQSSSESSDSEDENDHFHSKSKLPMFKGISSFTPTEPKSVPQHQVKREQYTKIESKQAAVTRDNNSFKKFLEPAHSTDILKKFESFSDVWKDDDEVSQPLELKYNAKLGKKQRNDGPLIKPVTNEWQTFDKSQESAVGTNAAEEKRLKSIEEKRHAFEQQKRAVQQALSDKNAPRSNKKIVFDDDGIDNVETAIPTKKPRIDSREGVTHKPQEKKSKALSLFDDSDDETANWSGEFQVKKQFEGHKGKKLLELQSGYNNDQRFKLDERFYDSDDESRNKSDKKSEESEPGIAEDLAEEREKQLEILSGILGKPISVSLPPSHHESKTQGMLRFDPSKPNHSKYELTKEPHEGKKKKKSKLDKKIEDEDEEVNEENDETVTSRVRREEKDPEPVSQTKFYSVSDTLADSLKLAKEGQSSGFSLLQMFGSSNSSLEVKEKHPEVFTKSLHKGPKKGFMLDDSSSEDEETEQGPTAVVNSSAFQSTNSSISGVRSTGGVWQESFFFQPNDDRLKEGADFFSQIDSSDPALFSKKREALKRIVKLKLRKTNRKANSFKNKVGTLRKKANLWPKSSNGQRPRKRQKH
ncbi:probable RNA-binding protein CG14230 [Frankliniella occidentalis]|uniref:Probable RNA-binding protein CG14230 n=1 Tax=Frankliniella occidentalis TaxID=133901 RepID=A0A6J1SYQ5_FRAOC|nr:probable RNA-binding protein CG14230 [Frankliniella occidentalis]XP_052125700.1 probable RNA-binding protein CG14230 [Frankliniella occidentalis]